MPIVRIQHPVADYDRWKQAFDLDPVARRRSGVLRYEILREIGDPNLVMIDLGFATTAEAEAFLDHLRPLWARVQGSLITDPSARIMETVESIELQELSSEASVSGADSR